MAFIVFEGLDGSGKTTLIKKLSELLDQSSVAHTITREPGGTPLGDELRTILLRVDGDTPTPRTEILLYEAIRAHHVDTKIKPALERGEWVLCDRYTASSLAFQAGGRKLQQEDIEWLNNFATNNLAPDLFVLLDLTVEESESRRLQRELLTSVEADRFEREKKDFHERIRSSYLQQAHKNPEKWLVLDASQKPEKLYEQFINKLKEKKWLK